MRKFIEAVNHFREVYEQDQAIKQFNRISRLYFSQQEIEQQKEYDEFKFTFNEEYQKLREDSGVDDPTGALPLIDQYHRDLLRAVAQYKHLALVGADIAVKKAEEVRKPDINIATYSAILNAAGNQVNIENRKVIEQRTKEGYFKGVKFSQKGLHPYRIAVAFNLPYDKSVIEALQARNTRAFAGVTDDMGKEIIRQVSDGAINGETIPQITKRIENAVDGIGPARAETIARTELMKSVNTGVRLRYESAGITKMRRMETKDEKTCKTWEFDIDGQIYLGCASIDGKTFTLEQAAQIDMQTHPDCRGTWVPVIEGLAPHLSGIPA